METDDLARNYADELTPEERQWVQATRQRIGLERGLFQHDQFGQQVTDDQNRPIPLTLMPCPSRRWAIAPDRSGDYRVWRFYPNKSFRMPDQPDRGGTPRRHHTIELWTGDWRKLPREGCEHIARDKLTPEQTVYAKSIREVPHAPGVGWVDEITPAYMHYLRTKGWKHPLDPPDSPDGRQVAAMEHRRVHDDQAILAYAQGKEQGGVTAAKMIGQEQTPAPPAAPATPAAEPAKAPETPKAEKRLTVWGARAMATEAGIDVSHIKGKGALGLILAELEKAGMVEGAAAPLPKPPAEDSLPRSNRDAT